MGNYNKSPDNQVPVDVTPGCSWLDVVQVQRFDCLYNATPSATLTLGDVLDTIVDGTYAPAIDRLRQLYARRGEDAYAAAKRRLSQFTFGGTFTPTRAKAHLLEHSGIVHADLDHLSDLRPTKLTLMQDPYVVYCFASPRGDGLKYGVRILSVTTDEAYKHAWQTICDLHQQRYGVIWDPSGKNVDRLCYVSWDPTTYINPDAAVFLVPPPPPPPPAPRVTAHTLYTWPATADAARRALERAVRLVLEAPMHQKHFARCRASYLLGGYIGSGHLDYATAYAALADAVRATSTHAKKALKDIEAGLQAGQDKPIVPDRPILSLSTVNAREVPPWHA